MPARSHSNALLAKAEKQLQLGEMQKAIDLCQQVLSKKPRHPEANTLMMHATQASGDLKSAYHYARQALATDQNNPEYLLSTALILHEAKKSDEAIVLAKRVLEIDSQFSDAYLFLGELHHQLLDHDQALEYLHQLLELTPDNQLAYEILFYIYELRHDDKAIQALLTQAKKYFPDCLMIAEGKLLQRQSQPDKALALYDQIISTPSSRIQESMAWIEKSHLLDKAGKYEEAFEAAARGQGIQKVLAECCKRPEDDFFSSLVNISTIWFDSKEKVMGWNQVTFDDGIASPAFLVGFPRSGTTLTERTLAAHSDTHVLSELNIISNIIIRMNRLLEGKYVYPNCLDDLTTKQIIKLRHHYMEIIQAKEGKIDSGKLLIDKMPLDIVHIGLICRIFPDAKILVALRDPRDVILSCFMQHFAPNSAMRHFYTLEDTVDMYCNVMQLYLRYQDIFERKPHSFRYEDMVTDQKATLSAIIEYLGLGWQEDMLKFYDKKNIQNVFTPSYQGVSQPVYRSAQGRWKHYERYFKPYQGKLAPLLDALGY